MKTWLNSILALCLLALSVSAQDEKLPVNPMGVFRSRNGLELPNELDAKKVLEAGNDIIHPVTSSTLYAQVPSGNLEPQTTEESRGRPVLPKRNTSGPKLMYCWSPSGLFMCGLNGRK